MENEFELQLIELLDHCGVRLHWLLTKLMTNRDVADELLQDLFVRQLNSKSLSQAANPEAYLFRSAINLAFDWRKKSKSGSTWELLDDEIAASEKSPIEMAIEREKTERVLATMASDRGLISLRYIQDESYEWIAEHFDTTAHRIRSRCSIHSTRAPQRGSRSTATDGVVGVGLGSLNRAKLILKLSCSTLSKVSGKSLTGNNKYRKPTAMS